jgi:hypothetical protein
MIQINYLAVLVAALAQMVIGGLWYGPLFGKTWTKLAGITPQMMESAKKKGVAKLYAAQFLGSLVMAYVLAHFAFVWGTNDVASAFSLAFWIWLGFIATVALGSILWEGKSTKLYWINTIYSLIGLFVMSLILTFWK